MTEAADGHRPNNYIELSREASQLICLIFPARPHASRCRADKSLPASGCGEMAS